MERKLFLHLFLNISKLLEDRIREDLDPMGIFHGQGKVLAELYKNDGMTQISIAKTLGISPATVTNMVKRMESGGLVKRHSDKHDDRVIRVHLTKEGNRSAEKVIEVWENIDSYIRTLMPETDLESLHKVLNKVKFGLGGADEGCESGCRESVLQS
ncbi:MarR family transcriptional regulator [Geovibrio thiophilus]|uniref:MarR family transcriptional regulator n=1 Tax=Geovibrio thiophilus TaxID=139438 RepID=A0A410K0S8_9BACT|nr:MarR family transcriptional regulator [Geovibrio thiophilus]QAR33989.1 MarR family transcriptional regulator [Geovibrio thiophilus]